DVCSSDLDAEFFPAKPANDGVLTGVIADGAGDALQGDVADCMTEAVVDGLEMIGVDNEQRAAPSGMQRRGDGGDEAAMVEAARKAVAGRGRGQLRIGAFE